MNSRLCWQTRPWELILKTLNKARQHRFRILMWALQLLMLLLTIGPLWLVTRDMFDGAPAAYAGLIANSDGLYKWLSDANWQVAIYVYKFVFFLVAALDLPYWLVFKLFLTGILLGLLFEFKRLIADLFGLQDSSARLLALLCLASPSLYTLVSSAIVMIIFCIWLAFIGHRLFWSSSVWVRLIGLVLMAVSFQLNSSMVFMLALDVVYLYRFAGQRKQRFAWFALLFLSALSVYVTMRALAPPHGIFIEYNRLLNPLNAVDLQRMVRALLMFMTWGLIPTTALVLVWISARWSKLGRQVSLGAMLRSLASWQVGCCIFLCASAAFPYIMVGKGSPLFTFTALGQGLTEQVLRATHDGPLAPTWASLSGRHALLFAIPLAMLTWFLCAQLRERLTGKDQSAASVPLFLLMAPLFLFWVLGSFANKLAHQAAETSLLNGLKQMTPAPAGVVEIKYTPASDWLIWTPAAGTILQQAWGMSHYYAMFYSLDVYRDDMQWAYHAYIRQTGALNAPLILSYLSMSKFPGEECTTHYEAQLPSSWQWLLLSGVLPSRAPAAHIQLLGTRCEKGYVMPNPNPEKILIP